MRVVAIDFETANARPDSPCAVGWAVIEGGRVVHRDHRLIRPREMRFDRGNIWIHGIRPEHVEDAPEFPEAMAGFVGAMEGALLVAHNAGFDMRVLDATARAYRMALPAYASLCTVALGRRFWPEAPNHKLSTLAGALGIPFQHHHAGEDAYACAMIAPAAVEAAGARDVADLASRLGFRRARAALAAPRAGGIADRALAGLAPRLRAAPEAVEPVAVDEAPATERQRFTVRGSRGASYEVVLSGGAAGLRARCTCMSARFRPVCKHAAALIAGDRSAVLTVHAETPRGPVPSAARIF